MPGEFSGSVAELAAKLATNSDQMALLEGRLQRLADQERRERGRKSEQIGRLRSQFVGLGVEGAEGIVRLTSETHETAARMSRAIRRLDTEQVCARARLVVMRL